MSAADDEWMLQNTGMPRALARTGIALTFELCLRERDVPFEIRRLLQHHCWPMNQRIGSQRTGFHRGVYQDGISEGEWRDGYLHGIHHKFSLSGMAMTTLVDGRLCGLHYQRVQSGMICEVGTRDIVGPGISVEFQQCGYTLSCITPRLKSEKHGVQMTVTYGGMSYVTYCDGVRNGPAALRLEDCTRYGMYVDGWRDGVWKGYYHDGTLESQGAYQHGELVGLYVCYNRDGTVDRACLYDMDAPGRLLRWFHVGHGRVTKFICDDPQ